MLYHTPLAQHLSRFQLGEHNIYAISSIYAAIIRSNNIIMLSSYILMCIYQDHEAIVHVHYSGSTYVTYLTIETECEEHKEE